MTTLRAKMQTKLAIAIIAVSLATSFACVSHQSVMTELQTVRIGHESSFHLSPSSWSVDDRSQVSDFTNIWRTDLSARLELLSTLVDDAVRIARNDGWDGPHTLGVSEATNARALVIAAALPVFLPIPDVSVTPSGSVAFEWDNGPDAHLAILAAADVGISFAVQFEGFRNTGAMCLESDELPSEVVTAATRWNYFIA